jgi:ketosteroid isomerase-like protein
MRMEQLLLVGIAGRPACVSFRPATDPATLRQQVMDTERAFARTMADRDAAAIATFLADETIFFAGETPIRGAAAVIEGWSGFFEGPTPPFSWEPDAVHVLDSGTLAMSTGPVYDPNGNLISRFNSIWRQESPGRWRIVFDKGSPICPPPTAQ